MYSTIVGETSGLEAVDKADSLWRIRKAQAKDESLGNLIEKEVIIYHTAANGTFLYRNRVCVSDDELLRKELQQVHHSKFSIHSGSTKMYQDRNEKGCGYLCITVPNLSNC